MPPAAEAPSPANHVNKRRLKSLKLGR